MNNKEIIKGINEQLDSDETIIRDFLAYAQSEGTINSEEYRRISRFVSYYFKNIIS